MSDAREVFSLRRSGKFEEAFTLASALYEAAPDEIWNIRALGWSIHDGLKTATKAGDTERAKDLLDKFLQLPIGSEDDDAILRETREYWIQRLEPIANGESIDNVVATAASYSKSGKHVEALTALHAILAKSPKNKSIQSTLAWSIYRALKEARANDNRGVGSLDQMVLQYQRLDSVEKPSLIHSLMLREVAQIEAFRKSFIRFFKWWNPAYLRPEDFNRYEPEGTGRSFDSLVEKVIRATYQSAKESRDKLEIRWAQEFVGEHMNRFPNQEWFKYYYGKLLVWAGDPLKAREYILPILRRKQSEFWAWDCLASTYGPEDSELRMALLARALQCRTQDASLLINVRQSLAELLLERGMLLEAAVEIHEVIKQREAKGWKLGEQLTGWQQEAWMLDSRRPQSNAHLYQTLAAAADDIVNEGLPEFEGVVARHIAAKPGEKLRTIISVKLKDRLQNLRVARGRFPVLAQLDVGTPVSLRINDSERELEIVSLTGRAGDKWDIVPPAFGILAAHNINKGVTVVALAGSETILFHHDTFPEIKDVAVGQCLLVKFTHGKVPSHKHSLTWSLALKEPTQRFWTDFDGVVTLLPGKAFGFVGSAYIAPEIVSSLSLKSGEQVRVRAVSVFNGKRNEDGLRAVRVDRINGGPYGSN